MNRQKQCSAYGLMGTVALSAFLGGRVCAQETPQTANRFCDSIGINTQLGTTNSPYASNSDGSLYSSQDFYNKVQIPLAWLGVRHIRDYMAVDYVTSTGAPDDGTGVASNGPNLVLKRLQTLGTQGVKCDLSINPIYTHTPAHPALEAQGVTNSYLLGCQEAVEGANEWDNAGPGISGSYAAVARNQTPPDLNAAAYWDSYSWEQGLNTETSDIWSYYRGRSSTAGIQVYSGTIVDLRHTDPNDPAKTDYITAHGTVSGKVDYASCHPYCYSQGDPDAHLSDIIHGGNGNYGESQLWGNSGPFVITETGYYTGIADPAQQYNFNVSPIVQEKYTLRTLFAAFNLGAYRTYLFELYDNGNDTKNHEQNFGLIYNNGTVKPAYTALECLIQLLSDASTSTAVTPLTWSLGGNTATVRHTLLQKSDGSYYLALWLGVASDDTTKSQAVTVTVPSTITVGSLSIINQFGSMPDPTPVTITNGQMSLNVTDTVSILKLTGPIIESPTLALNKTSVSKNGGTVTATVTFKNVSASAMTFLPYIGARDATGNNVDFGAGASNSSNANVTLAAGQTVSVSATKTLTAGMNAGTWTVFGTYRTASNVWYTLAPTLTLAVTN